ncbi:MAG: DUF305 domain-containing protein [Clostridium sp.]|uniref:DUF305 domain-containing protein n=1 Tax=Clostridium sp. DSM 8431 TaxID=1761781 RepID=UPI0008DF5863|nr:DUF305 domain-containing protein [Clostridium sp. DSM 8431]MCR4943979.1 DUF305 domain-containing protein [Clostridium sp.]SFU85726.1 protein of unknown function [Clostridium sp. DSM 8431]
MNRKGRFLILIISMIMLFISGSNAYGREDIEDYIKEYKSSIYHMSKMIRCIPKSGDLNLDYLYEIAMLSEGEIEFSKAYVNHANCYKVKGVAEGYIERETSYINNIKSVIENLKDNVEKNEELEEKYLEVFDINLNKMIDDFQKVEISENIDDNFLSFISIHHNGIIDITEEFLKLSDNKEVRDIANKVSNDMKNDLKVIKEVL